MDDATLALVRVSALLAAGREDALPAALQVAGAVAGPVAVEEALLQSYLFLGYPRALRAMHSWRDVSGVRAPASRATDEAEWEARGERVCGVVYGGQYERLRTNVNALHPDLEHWMVVEGYGKVLGRPGLELRVRELCIIALLARQNASAQLYSHLRGALNAGASYEEVAGVLELALADAPGSAVETAAETWRQVRERYASS